MHGINAVVASTSATVYLGKPLPMGCQYWQLGCNDTACCLVVSLGALLGISGENAPILYVDHSTVTSAQEPWLRMCSAVWAVSKHGNWHLHHPARAQEIRTVAVRAFGVKINRCRHSRECPIVISSDAALLSRTECSDCQ
ncbi:unnamed protein product [Ostreobium quekettii]|uniref:Uncharacterized protein n=1 Tax=Ostreobium quekettii TaxID=121088 RepID=A0A8S1IS94_9CHLO|nr:unnamed protein product [Ostreobium quekettii]